VYLILGHPANSTGREIALLLSKRGCEVGNIPNTLANPIEFSWNLDFRRSHSRVTLANGRQIASDDIQGVFVCGDESIGLSQLRGADLVFLYRETRAALLGWIWSLECQVVNRYPPPFWYRRYVPVQFWERSLKSCGLSFADCLLTNVKDEVQTFYQATGSNATYTSLTSEIRFRLADKKRWPDLLLSSGGLTVHLRNEPMDSYTACVVGKDVLWRDISPTAADRLEIGLAKLAAVTGLWFLEVTFVAAGADIRVADIRTEPRLQLFTEATREIALEKVIALLQNTGDDLTLPNPG
jgi:hypothetical protein